MLKKLKSLFVIEDESQSSKASTGVKETKTISKEAPSTGGKKPQLSNPDAKPSKKFLDVLLKAIEANNLEGFDYLEFKQSLQSLSNMDMDEITKYQSALAMAKTMGATKAKLVQSAKHYVAVLMEEEKKFLDAVENQRTKQVSSKQNKLKQLENLIIEKDKKIIALQAEIVKHKDTLEKEKTNINQSAAKVEATKDGFIAAYNQVLSQINGDIKRMESHL
jgi:hypothetical protein